MEYTDFELNLRKSMVPVRPDPGFVDSLNQRLRTQKQVFIEQSRGTISPALTVAGIILGIGLVFLIMGRFRRKS